MSREISLLQSLRVGSSAMHVFRSQTNNNNNVLFTFWSNKVITFNFAPNWRAFGIILFFVNISNFTLSSFMLIYLTSRLIGKHCGVFIIYFSYDLNFFPGLWKNQPLLGLNGSFSLGLNGSLDSWQFMHLHIIFFPLYDLFDILYYESITSACALCFPVKFKWNSHDPCFYHPPGLIGSHEID